MVTDVLWASAQPRVSGLNPAVLGADHPQAVLNSYEAHSQPLVASAAPLPSFDFVFYLGSGNGTVNEQGERLMGSYMS